MLGGFGNLQSPVDVVEKYDPLTGQWCAVQVSFTYSNLHKIVKIVLTVFMFCKVKFVQVQVQVNS